MDAASGIFIAIPGPWQSRTQLVQAIAESNMAKALFAGVILLDIDRGRHVELFVHDRDPALARTMLSGSGEAIDDVALAAIDAHALLTVLCFDAKPDGLAERLAFFTSTLRKAGGLGVRVEASGVAHPWSRWEQLLEKGDAHSLYHALVVHVGGGETNGLSSFGMRQFELPDAMAPFSDLDAAWLIATFNLYQWTEQPVFKDGQTFSMDKDSPRYRLNHTPDTRYEPGHHYLNPNGIWELRPMT
jgi:hypothetical protein